MFGWFLVMFVNIGGFMVRWGGGEEGVGGEGFWGEGNWNCGVLLKVIKAPFSHVWTSSHQLISFVEVVWVFVKEY